MKIAYILTSFPRLHNTFILNEILGLMDHGHEVFVFSVYRSNEKVVNEGVKRIQEHVVYFDDVLREKNQLKYLTLKVIRRIFRNNQSILMLFGHILFEKNKIIDLDIYFPDLNMRVYALPELAKIIRMENIDIIQAGFANKPATIAMLLSKLTDIPYTFEAHAFDLFVDFPYSNEKISGAKKIFTISYYNKNYLLENYKPDVNKIAVFRVPFNYSFCDQIKKKERKTNLIVTACRLHPIKGLEYAIEAFSLLCKKIPDLKFNIIGDGELRDVLEKRVEQLSLKNNVIFIGDLANEKTLEMISESTVFLLPSVIAENGDRDGIPTSLIEAMYLKTPVVSTYVSGIPELIDNEINRILVQPKEAQELAEKLEDLLVNKHKREKLGEEARLKVEREFKSQDNIQILINNWTGN